jgi:putative ABC transport system permease protein
MLKNYLKIAFRNITKNTLVSFVNFFGLSVGLAFGALVLLYVNEELSYDKFHKDGDRIYRISTWLLDVNKSTGGKNSTNGWGVARALKNEYPEVEDAIYMRRWPMLSIKHEDHYYTEKLIYAEEKFFDFFSLPLKSGNPRTALIEPYTLVITKAMEDKFFNGDGLGKILLMADTINFKVTGVLDDFPGNTHLKFDLIISFATFKSFTPNFDNRDDWFSLNMVNYLKLREGVDLESFKAKSENLYMDKAGEVFTTYGYKARLDYDAVQDIYLDKDTTNALGTLGNMQHIKILSIVAAVVLLLACINYINLATARSSYRAKEVGLRKVVGSTRKSLFAQFMAESFLSGFISFIIAIALAFSLLPLFNELTGREYVLNSFFHVHVLGSIIALWVIVSLLSGAYPAWIISGQNSIAIIKGVFHTGKAGVRLRQSLVIVQFFISSALIVSTLVVMDQLGFMMKQELGFDNQHVLIVHAGKVGYDQRNSNYKPFKNELTSLAGVEHVAYTNAIPGNYGWDGQVAYPEGKSMEESVSTEFIVADEDYVKTLGFQLLAGRNFDTSGGSELPDALIINETCVLAMGWESAENAIGKRIDSPSGMPRGVVVGVIKDYHQHGLQEKIRPVVLSTMTQYASQYVIRYSAASTQELLTQIETQWKTFFAGRAFEYSFLDEAFAKQYASESRLANIFATFATIAIIIAVVGLFGLVSFVVAFKTKEIGIRKVLGAETHHVFTLLSRDFILLVVIGFVLAVPVITYVMNNWLQNFAYKTSINSFTILLTGLGAILIALITISYHALKASATDPVKSLRYE